MGMAIWMVQHPAEGFLAFCVGLLILIAIAVGLHVRAYLRR